MYSPYLYFYGLPYCYPAFSQLPYPLPLPIPTFSSLYSLSTETPIIKQEREVQSAEQACTIIKEEQQPAKSQQPCKVSRFKYVKKNVESNVVNQVISFLSIKGKSGEVLMRILGSKEKMDAFYEIMKLAKKNNRKYMGRAMLQSLLQVDEDHPVFILHKKLKSRVSLKLNQIRKALRILTNYFLRSHIVQTLLTSSKLDKTTLRQHLTRARQIYCYVNNLPSPYAN